MKTRLTHAALYVALAASLVACGKTADVLTSHADAGTSGENGDTGGATGKGRASTGGNGGSSASGTGAQGGESADGGAPTPDGGTVADPHVAERRSLSDQLCGLLDKYPCLSSPVLGGQGTGTLPNQTCNDELNIEGYGFPSACWNDWVATMKCLIAKPHQCPCGNDCMLLSPGESEAPSVETPCNTAFLACVHSQPVPDHGTVTGSRLTCDYSASADTTSCEVYCRQEPSNAFVGECSGPPGGPYGCDVTLNNRPMWDDATGPASYYADDCRSAAQAMADGGDGVSDVDCCFTWSKSPDAGAAGNNLCSCTADPTKAGFASCAAAAAAGHGQVVALCPQYLPPPGGVGFPGQ